MKIISEHLVKDENNNIRRVVGTIQNKFFIEKHCSRFERISEDYFNQIKLKK